MIDGKLVKRTNQIKHLKIRSICYGLLNLFIHLKVINSVRLKTTWFL